MSILHKIKGFFIEEYELKSEISNLVAVSIFIDSIVRPSEVFKAYEILENVFNGEDYEYLKDEVDILLEDFQKDAICFIEAKEKAINFIKKNKKIRRELIEIVKLIFRSDHELHKKEEELIIEIEKNTKTQGED